jgi:hypothetical protein
MVEYHRYEPAKTPCAYTIDTAAKPGAGVWRKMQSLDEVFESETQAQPAPSEELRIARLGYMYAAARLGPVVKELVAADRKKELKEQNLKNGAPFEKQVQDARAKLERMESVARDAQFSYCTWKHMKGEFEKSEHGKVSAVEMSV